MKCREKLQAVLLAVLILGAPVCCCGFLFGQYPLERMILRHRADKLEAAEQRLATDPHDDDAAQLIVRYMNSSDSTTVGMALRSMGQVDSATLDEIHLIAPYLSHDDHYTRRSAILAVKDRGDEAIQILDEVIACLDDPVGIDVRVFAGEVISTLGVDAALALPALRAAAVAPENESFHDEFTRYVQRLEAAIEDHSREPQP